jgi:hypothetical protein
MSPCKIKNFLGAKRRMISCPEAPRTGMRNGQMGSGLQGRVAQIGLTGKKKVPKLGEMC